MQFKKTQVVSGHVDGGITVWDWSMGKVVKEMRGHIGECRSVEVSPNANELVSAGFDGIVMV
jgi:WD40 repeat protein